MVNDSSSALERCRKLANAALCPIYGACIIATLLLYGLWQERIMVFPYPFNSQETSPDYFAVSVFLVLFNRLFGLVFALLMIAVMQESFGSAAPLWKYALISVSTVAASICQYEALKYVSFVVQILGKSFKMMPVMCWGNLVLKKKYRLIDWFVAAGITIGVIWFMVSGKIWPDNAHGNAWYGIALIVAFIVVDGFTTTFQEKLFAENRTSKYNQMLYINLCSAVLSIITLLISGHTKNAWNFCVEHPRMWVDISILSGTAVSAQWFIFSQVQEFGALAFAVTMNMRQVASVLGSYLAYHPWDVSLFQMIGLAIVFFSLALQSIVGLAAKAVEETGLLKQRNEADSNYAATVIKLKKTTAAHCLPCWRAV